MIFAAPLALAALALLPALYFILRLTPPAPRRLRFPPIALLRDLSDTESTPDRLPLWMLLFRLLAAALLIIGFAGPTLRPPPVLPGSGPVLLVVDNGWAAAASWPQLTAAGQRIIAAAQAQNRDVALLATARDATNSPLTVPNVTDASTAAHRLAALQPQPWPSDRSAAAALVRDAPERTRFYLADGVGGDNFPAFLQALHPTRILKPFTLPPLLGPPTLGPDGGLRVHAISNPGGQPLLAETATGTILARQEFTSSGDAVFTLPPGLQNRIARLVLAGDPTAGGTALADSSLHTTLAGLDMRSANADTPFLGALYYLRRALPASTRITTGTLPQLIAAHPGLIFLTDTPLDAAGQEAARHYVEAGGVLVRFAGPETADRQDNFTADPLLRGDRRLGGALSWTTPETLSPFPAASPFAGLAPDPKVTVSRQILADPGSLDPATVWASLNDGTPLILGQTIGRGTLVNILTTANTDWSNLVLSGLYPQLIARLTSLSQSVPTAGSTAQPLSALLNAFGTLTIPTASAVLTPAQRDTVMISATQPPGLYGPGDGAIALNLGQHIPPLVAARLPGAQPFGDATPPERLGPGLIAIAMLLFAIDLLISLILRGAFSRRRFLLALLLCLALPPAAQAQNAALQTGLGYILTNDPATDKLSADALGYLSTSVSAHTSVALGPPVALTPGRDDLSLYPLIYWPLPPGAPPPTQAACADLSRYMDHGGLLMIDTQGGDADASGSGAGFADGAAATFARDTACLNLPPLEKLTTASVLAHSFYIIPDFPGRFTGAPVLIAAASGRDADNVTPVIVGQNDWAGAWARDAGGNGEQAPIPGGEAQRLIADRFGINLVIYALTGSYKADQNTAPALLDQLQP
ncbi:MAG TPA: DUF4159 domain-containing protein [Acidocella sp.]|jgi:hypothetical protein|uniref:DUF4159 domain-containing protein n=1 Tax=Acidocella sp. TaxID=50710 RepID=UPI002CF9FC74|nr:DUF4159 domain-containing protein [Acidocella sp.]HVE21643.1 DUF4159 domain-containing protein [Acidocella sp.]